MMWKRKAATRETTRVAPSPDDALSRAEEAHIRGDYEAAAAGYGHVLGDANPLAPATRVRILRQMTEVHHLLGHSDEADVVSVEAVQLARQLGGSPLAEALWNAGYVAWCRKDLENARGVLEEAVELARVHDEPPNNRDLGPALLNLARVSFSRGEWDRGRELIDELMTLVTFQDSLYAGAKYAQWMAREAGDFEKAMHWADVTWNAMTRDDTAKPRWLIGALCRWAYAALDVGEFERARIAVAQAIKLAEGVHGAAAHQAAGTLALEEEDWKRAESYFERALVAAVKDEKLSSRLMLAYAMLSAGDHGRAEEIVETVQAEIADATDNLAAYLLVLEGGIRHASGDLDRARAAYDEACEGYRRIGWHASAAETSLQLGIVEADAGRRDLATRCLSEATPLSERPSNQRLRAKLAYRLA